MIRAHLKAYLLIIAMLAATTAELFSVMLVPYFIGLFGPEGHKALGPVVAVPFALVIFPVMVLTIAWWHPKIMRALIEAGKKECKLD